MLTYSPTTSLTVLLTTESLLFAVFALTLGFGGSALPRVLVVRTARRMTIAVAAVLTTMGIGAATAWVDLFTFKESLHGFAEWIPAAAVAVGAVAQPAFAWIFVANVRRR